MATRRPNWYSLIGSALHVKPVRWKDFWSTTRLHGPRSGIRWLTLADHVDGIDTIVVTTSEGESRVRIGQLLGQVLDRQWLRLGSAQADEGGAERVLLHIPSVAQEPETNHPQGTDR
jgi:hypothetical protein